MADMEKGQACGTCHNGQVAFNVKEKADCTKCHKK
jgi:c(7)-type cytochrome triheme protein